MLIGQVFLYFNLFSADQHLYLVFMTRWSTRGPIKTRRIHRAYDQMVMVIWQCFLFLSSFMWTDYHYDLIMASGGLAANFSSKDGSPGLQNQIINRSSSLLSIFWFIDRFIFGFVDERWPVLYHHHLPMTSNTSIIDQCFSVSVSLCYWSIITCISEVGWWWKRIYERLLVTFPMIKIQY